MLRELEIVKLTRPLPSYGLKRGARGTIVHRYRDGEAFEVEFLDPSGDTIAVATLEPEYVTPARRASMAANVDDSRRKSGKNVRIVFRRDDGKWVNMKAGASKASSVHKTQRSAMDAAKDMLRNAGGGRLTTKRRDGTVTKRVIEKNRDSHVHRGRNS